MDQHDQHGPTHKGVGGTTLLDVMKTARGGRAIKRLDHVFVRRTDCDAMRDRCPRGAVDLDISTAHPPLMLR
jgi:hypothetical protein